MFKAYFHWKPCRAEDLQGEGGARLYQVDVVKQIELTAAQYQHFATNLLEDMPFIAANKALMGRDDENCVSHCLLVTTRNIQGGILVECQGFNYARYAARVWDKSVLNLRDVPVERYDLKPLQPLGQREAR